MLNRRNKDTRSETQDKKVARGSLLRLLVLVVITMALLAVYRFSLNQPYFFYVMITYMAVFTVMLLVYIIYNRGFSRRNVTAEMLPDEWSAEEKEAFLTDGTERLRKSKWMLMLIFAIGFTFAFDIIDLFVLPFFKNLF